MKNCVFCKIVKNELPSSKVYEDDKTLAFLDIHPINPGHTLVITKNPDVRNILDIPLEDWQAMTTVAHKLAVVVEKTMNADGVNILMNNRDHAGQVVDHPHIHIIPRFKDDGQNKWSHKDYTEGEAATVHQRVLDALK